MQIRSVEHRKASRLLLLGALCSSALAPMTLHSSWAQEFPRVSAVQEQPADNRLIIRSVRNLVEEGHISQSKFNDELSKRGFELFLKQVDPLKSYLLQSDVDEFRPSEAQLDDMLAKNNISFAYTVYKRYLQRLNELMPIIHEQIDAPQDYNIEEFIENDAKNMKYAASMDELTCRRA